MERLVCALFEDEPSAAAAIDDLINGGISERVVSVVMHQGEVTHEDLGVAAESSGRRMAQGAAIGATVGAVVGGLLAGPAGLLAGGPLAGVLAGGATGGLYASIAGAITGRDEEKHIVEELGESLRAGKVLVTVDVEGPVEIREEARRILARNGGRHIRFT